MRILEEAVIGGGAAMLLYALRAKIASLATYLRSLAIVQLRLPGGDHVGQALVRFLIDHARHWTIGDRHYYSSRGYVRPLDRVDIVVMQQDWCDTIVFLYGRAVILFSATDEDGSNRLWAWLRGTVDLKKLTWAAIQYAREVEGKSEDRNSSKRHRISRMYGRREKFLLRGRSSDDDEAPDTVSADKTINFGLGVEPLHWSWEDLGQPDAVLGLDRIALSGEHRRLVERLRFWHKSEEWFRERGVPWRMGCCLYGEPGGGKSTFACAVAEALDLPMFSFDLASMTDADMIEKWKTVMEDTPCCVLFEDLDTVFDGRRNLTGPDGLTFGCFINTIGGVEPVSGVLTFVTTNHPGKLDPAIYDAAAEHEGRMASRPGRIDWAVEFGALTEENRRSIAATIVRDPAAEAALVLEGDGDTAAQFTERCVQRALAAWFSAL